MSPLEMFEGHNQEIEAATTKAQTLEKILEKRTNYVNRIQGRDVNKLINILIVPGHDDENWGTEFQGVKEVELNRELAQNLHNYLLNEKGINSVLASDGSGYNTIFEKYFKREEQKIEDFIKKSKKTFSKKIKKGDLDAIEKNFHNVAPAETVYRLYGINRWVNVQNFDLVIHVHFNDYRGREWEESGTETGFSIYTPGKYFENYELSRKMADSIFAELKKVQSVSTLESEQEGVIEDHELIALGANESLEAGSVLVEYGYIYENNFIDPEKRKIALDYFAYATYSGIKKLINEEPQKKIFAKASLTKNKNTTENTRWQFQKALLGEYPPEGKNFEDCPISGYFGECSLGVK